MNGAIFRIWRRPNILLSSFSAIAASSRASSMASSNPISEQPASPNPMTTKYPPMSCRDIRYMLEHFLYRSCYFCLPEAQSISLCEHFYEVPSPVNLNDAVSFLTDEAYLRKPQLRRAVRLRPSILISSVLSALLPDLDALRSLLPPGYPPAALSSLVTACAASFGHSPSLILPALTALRHLLLNSPPKVVSALLRCPDLLAHPPDHVISRNADLLRSRGLTDPVKLAHLICQAPAALILSPHDLELAFSNVQRELGLTMGDDGGDDGGDDDCINAVALAVTLTEEEEEGGFVKRIEMLRRFGFKEEDMRLLVRTIPGFMRLPVSHVLGKLEFFRDEVGFGPGEMIQTALLHLEKRMIPRHNFLKGLREKGWFTADVDMCSAFLMSREEFEKEFVDQFREVRGKSLVRKYLKCVEHSCSIISSDEAAYKRGRSSGWAVPKSGGAPLVPAWERDALMLWEGCHYREQTKILEIERDAFFRRENIQFSRCGF